MKSRHSLYKGHEGIIARGSVQPPGEDKETSCEKQSSSGDVGESFQELRYSINKDKISTWLIMLQFISDDKNCDYVTSKAVHQDDEDEDDSHTV